MDDCNDTYSDIINLPHWEPKNHNRMATDQRAAQFAPFAALSGHDAAIKETARCTDSIDMLERNDTDDLNRKFIMLLDRIGMHPSVEIAYFLPDIRKQGGAYVSHKGVIKKFDDYKRTLVFEDGCVIPIKHIIDISGL